MLQALLDSKDFLALTLAHPEQFDGEFSFNLGDHTQVEVWDTGVIVFEPIQNEGKDIVLSCGVHGNETAPIELCNSLIKQLLQQKIIAKQRTLFLIGNPLAINNGTRIIDENMNRLFSGEHSNPPGLVNPERVRAKNSKPMSIVFLLQQPMVVSAFIMICTRRCAPRSMKSSLSIPIVQGAPLAASKLCF